MTRLCIVMGFFLGACSSAVATEEPGVLPELEEDAGGAQDSGTLPDAVVREDSGSKDGGTTTKDSGSNGADAGKDSGSNGTDAGKDSGSVTVDAGKDSGATAKPTEITITGSFGSVKAIHIMSSDKKQIISSLSVGPKPSMTPQPGWELPNVTKAGTITIDAPSKGSCTEMPSFTLNSSQIGMMITAVDTLPASACATFIDDIASKGMTATLTNVPYPNGGSAKVIIKLKP